VRIDCSLCGDQIFDLHLCLSASVNVLGLTVPGERRGGLQGKDGMSRQTEPVGPDPREKSNGNLIFKFQLNLDFGKTFRFSTRRLRRNLDKGMFHKFH
jgi:hypothetical protein